MLLLGAVLAAWGSCAVGPATATGPAESPPAAESPCPTGAVDPCVVVLQGPRAPSASPACTAGPWAKRLRFTLPERFADSNRDGAFETVLGIRLDPRSDCGCARFVVHLTGRVEDWAVNIGDSPTNNGHGGDLGTAPEAAEVQLSAGRLTLYTTAQTERRLVDQLLDVALPPLADRGLEFEICEQSLRVTLRPTRRDPHPLEWRLETQNARLLFSLEPDGAASGPAAADAIYAAFNRVIHVIDGAPSRQRTGASVRSVEISLGP